MTAVLIGVGVLGGLGLILACLLLSVANKVFEIPSDPKRDAVRNALPGANCGGCGYAGCDALADAIAAGKAPVNACPVGGAAAAAEIAKIMGVEETPQEVRKSGHRRVPGYARPLQDQVPVPRHQGLCGGLSGQRRKPCLPICLPGIGHLRAGLQV